MDGKELPVHEIDHVNNKQNGQYEPAILARIVFLSEVCRSDRHICLPTEGVFSRSNQAAKLDQKD